MARVLRDGVWFACIVAAGLLVLVASGCVEDDPCVCSMEFRMIDLEVVNEAGRGETGVEITTTLVRTGELIAPAYAGYDSTRYVIITDSEKDKIRSGLGDRLRVEGAKDTRSFDVEYLITVDECRCHIDKASGPDRVVLR